MKFLGHLITKEGLKPDPDKVFGCERFNQYLARLDKINVETDHKFLESIFRKSLLSAPPSRLQRTLLRLQRYNLSVSYRRCFQMLLVDNLYRAAQHQNCVPDDSYQVFSLEIEDTSPVHALRITLTSGHTEITEKRLPYTMEFSSKAT